MKIRFIFLGLISLSCFGMEEGAIVLARKSFSLDSKKEEWFSKKTFQELGERQDGVDVVALWTGEVYEAQGLKRWVEKELYVDPVTQNPFSRERALLFNVLVQQGGPRVSERDIFDLLPLGLLSDRASEVYYEALGPELKHSSKEITRKMEAIRLQNDDFEMKAIAAYHLAEMYRLKDEPDCERAAQLYRQGFSQDNHVSTQIESACELVQMYQRGEIGKKKDGKPDYATAQKLCEEIIEKWKDLSEWTPQVARMKCLLARMYRQGEVGKKDGKPDCATAQKLCEEIIEECPSSGYERLSYEREKTVAQMHLAQMYQGGDIGKKEDGEPDYTRAAQLFEPIVNETVSKYDPEGQGIKTIAECELGMMLAQGLVGLLESGERDYERAQKLLELAMLQEYDQDAQIVAGCYLGQMHVEGHVGIEPDYEKARELLEPVAIQTKFELEQIRAQCCLGLMYANGDIGMTENDEPNYEKARELLELVAVQTDNKKAQTRAQCCLGQMYAEGYVGIKEDGEPDYEKAQRLLEPVAAQEINKEAQITAAWNLGRMHAEGYIGLLEDGTPDCKRVRELLEPVVRQTTNVIEQVEALLCLEELNTDSDGSSKLRIKRLLTRAVMHEEDPWTQEQARQLLQQICEDESE